MSRIHVWGGGTIRTLRVHWLLHEAGLAYDATLIGSRTGETQAAAFRALNPKEKIPVLDDDGFVLTESAAIIAYVIERYANALAPPRGLPAARGRYDEWSSHILMELDAHTLYVIRKHEDLAHLYGDAPNACRAARAGFEKQSAVEAAALEAGGPWLLGGAFSGVDVLLGTCLYWARRTGIVLTPALAAHLRQVEARPAWQAAHHLNFERSGTCAVAGRP